MRRQWNRRYLLLFPLILISVYSFSLSTYSVSYDVVLHGVPTRSVWEFLMDFNNLKALNPTILDFSILADWSKGDEWSYEVRYREFLHQIPFIENTAIAVYKFLPISNQEYHIISKHITCFFANITCVMSSSEFIIRPDVKNPENTYCLEKVSYECPKIFSSFCRKEVMFQRKSIFRNLYKYMSND